MARTGTEQDKTDVVIIGAGYVVLPPSSYIMACDR